MILKKFLIFSVFHLGVLIKIILIKKSVCTGLLPPFSTTLKSLVCLMEKGLYVEISSSPTLPQKTQIKNKSKP